MFSIKNLKNLKNLKVIWDEPTTNLQGDKFYIGVDERYAHVRQFPLSPENLGSWNTYYCSPSLVWHVWESQKKLYYWGLLFSLMWQMA